MAAAARKKNSDRKNKNRPLPPGYIKITQSLIELRAEKEFNAITTAEIAKNAGVTEALIYKYFKDKRDLLHQVLTEYIERYHTQFHMDLKGIKGALNKLRKLIWTHINVYSTNRVFAGSSHQAWRPPFALLPKCAESCSSPENFLLK